MFKNRFVLILAALSMLLVSLAVSQPFVKSSKMLDRNGPSSSAMVPVTAPDAPASVMDSATRSYIAWGQAMQERNALDSATRSYIAQGKALKAAGKLGGQGACTHVAPQDLFAGIPDGLDSATGSYVGWGLALQAKDDFAASCR